MLFENCSWVAELRAASRPAKEMITSMIKAIGSTTPCWRRWLGLN
jgi:hypothetical protein